MNVETLFQEIPIRIKNSYFVNAMLSELEVVAPSPNKRPFLDLSTRFVIRKQLILVKRFSYNSTGELFSSNPLFSSNVLEKNVGLLLEGVDHLLAENSKITNHQKRVQRLQSDRIRIVQRKVLQYSFSDSRTVVNIQYFTCRTRSDSKKASHCSQRTKSIRCFLGRSRNHPELISS